MALYAYEEGFFINAADASQGKNYRCVSCKSLVKVRRGPFRVPHFYHLAKTPSCRLYSKSEDHMLAQLAIQRLLPPGETTLEKPFSEISRVADLAWERPKIAFEIQCSKLSVHEVRQRVHDYSKVGYQVVWILDDRIFNRKKIGEAEHLIRKSTSYYAKLRNQTFPIFYDQFEIDSNRKRLKRGHRLTVQLQRPYPVPLEPPEGNWLKMPFPNQVLHKIELTQIYFHGDLLHKAFLSKKIPEIAFSMHTLRVLEEHYKRKVARERRFGMALITRWILQPLGLFLLYLHERAEKTSH